MPAAPEGQAHLFYIDESYDEKKFIVTALGVRAKFWRPTFDRLKAFRKQLSADFGIKQSRELHATRFIRDCSDGISRRKLNIGERKRVFELALRHIAAEPAIKLINVCLDVNGRPLQKVHTMAIERLANRIQRTMLAKHSHAVVIIDEGREKEIRGLLRRMSVFNYIPSRFGTWNDGSVGKNIALTRLIEDPVFKDSAASYFLQMADFCAYTLLKHETTPTKFVKTWGYHRLFPILKPVLFLPASSRDPDGIVR